MPAEKMCLIASYGVRNVSGRDLQVRFEWFPQAGNVLQGQRFEDEFHRLLRSKGLRLRAVMVQEAGGQDRRIPQLTYAPAQ
jgi:hypothetical protein